MQSNALDCRDKVLAARRAFYRGEGSEQDLNSALDAYIEALKAHRKATGKRYRIPTRAYLLRAL